MQNIEKSRILVVNDDANSLFALTSLLNQRAETECYEVVAARSGEEALRQVLLHDFAVILLDVNMPGMDGFETAEAIHQRARSADIPIIFVTAFLADELDRLKAYQKGAADFLFTPIIPQILHAKVSVFVALAGKNQELKKQAQKLSERSAELTATNKRLTREIGERKMAERQNHAKDEFLAMLGHELRNPLSAISSAAALIGLPGASNEGITRAKDIIARQSRHLGRIVDDLLDLSRAMSGKILLARRTLDLKALAAACVDTFQATGRSSKCTLTLDAVPAWVDGDPTRLEQIISNLVDNALKYTAPGGTVDIGIRLEGDDIVLTVRDSGAGIAADLLPHVFDVFVQGASTLDRSQGGLGVGLALVRRLAELHGGSASARSDGPQTGSTFTIRLPAAVRGCADTPAAPVPAARNGRLLLIEDNEDGREVMALMLGCCGYEVRHASDGLQGLRVAAEFQPDLALVDIGLPGIDGYEVARRLRADPRTANTRLIALTGYGLADDKLRVLDAGFDLHLVKPVDIERLLHAIETCARAEAKHEQQQQ